MCLDFDIHFILTVYSELSTPNFFWSGPEDVGGAFALPFLFAISESWLSAWERY